MSYNEELRERQFRFMRNRAHLINYAFDNGYKLTAGEAFRSPKTQAEHVASGLSLTMNSMHLKRLADDYNIFIEHEDGTDYLLFQPKKDNETEQDYKDRIDRELLLAKPLGDYWCSLDKANRWGGDFDKDGNPINGNFKDGGHFENYFP